MFTLSQMKPKIAVLAALAIVAVALTALVGSRPSLDGPLQFSSANDQICAPASQYAKVAFGVNLPEGLDRTLTITAVTAVGAENLTIGTIKLMPVVPTMRLMLDHYPPVSQFPAEWKQATPAINELVPYAGSHDLVVEVIRSALDKQSSLAGLNIEYTVDGRAYIASTHLHLLLKMVPAC